MKKPTNYVAKNIDWITKADTCTLTGTLTINKQTFYYIKFNKFSTNQFFVNMIKDIKLISSAVLYENLCLIS